MLHLKSQDKKIWWKSDFLALCIDIPPRHFLERPFSQMWRHQGVGWGVPQRKYMKHIKSYQAPMMANCLTLIWTPHFPYMNSVHALWVAMQPPNNTKKAIAFLSLPSFKSPPVEKVSRVIIYQFPVFSYFPSCISFCQTPQLHGWRDGCSQFIRMCGS